MERLILDIIEEISEKKREQGIYPDSASYTEISSAIHKEVKKILNSLVKAKKVSWYRSLNDTNFKLGEKKKEVVKEPEDKSEFVDKLINYMNDDRKG